MRVKTCRTKVLKSLMKILESNGLEKADLKSRSFKKESHKSQVTIENTKDRFVHVLINIMLLKMSGVQYLIKSMKNFKAFRQMSQDQVTLCQLVKTQHNCKALHEEKKMLNNHSMSDATKSKNVQTISLTYSLIFLLSLTVIC